MQKTLRMEELVTRHSTIMDQYDPEKRIGLYVDEWGNWFDVEPGTERGFLYQQNSLWDAVVAAVNLNIFNNHCDRVKMANIAQTVNVLQAMILTREEKMIRTPSYYTFRLFKVHHDATLLPVSITCDDYKYEEKEVTSLSASASMNEEGIIHISLANLDPQKNKIIVCELRGSKATEVTGEILTSSNMTDHNDFDRGEIVIPKEFKGAKIKKGLIEIDMPAKSVVVLRIK